MTAVDYNVIELNHDSYSNFGAGKIRWFLEGFAGIKYSVVDQMFVVKDCQPDRFKNMTVMVPITNPDGNIPGTLEDRWKNVEWVTVNYEMDDPLGNGDLQKTISVSNNPLDTLKILPFLQERSPYDTNWTKIDESLIGSYPEPLHYYPPYDDFLDYAAASDTPPGYLRYTAPTPSNYSITLNLVDDVGPETATREWKQPPAISNNTAVTAQAYVGWDKDGTDYEFICLNDPAYNTFQSSAFYAQDFSGEAPGETFGFKWRAVDRSVNQNPGEWSETLWFTLPGAIPVYDDFNDGVLDTSKWSQSGSPVETNGVLDLDGNKSITGKADWSLDHNFTVAFDFKNSPSDVSHEKGLVLEGNGWDLELIRTRGTSSKNYLDFKLDGERIRLINPDLGANGSMKLVYSLIENEFKAYYA